MIKSYIKEVLDEDLQSDEQLYLYFYSPGCGPCKHIQPYILEWSKEYDKTVYMIESSEAQDLQKYLGVRLYPTVVVVKQQKSLYLAEGAIKIKELM